jgi:KUP system potassium uptake protein
MSSESSSDKEKTPTEHSIPKRTFKPDAVLSIRATLFLAVSSLGIIYGDIGTSPLYVLNAIFPAAGDLPSTEDVIGGCSAVIWSITIVPLIKYCFIALEFGNSSGEGGPFAVFTSIYPPPEETDENRALTSYTITSNKNAGTGFFLEKRWVHAILFAWVLFGTTLTMSDGLLTPAVSVVSAVQGLSVGIPSVANSIIGISVGVLVVLFLIQIMGTAKVSFTFAPIVAVWLATIGISGIVNIVQYPGVFRGYSLQHFFFWRFGRS